jgi:SRSO17 transposase
LGKVENCQVGVFLGYVTAAGYAPLDRQLYLPREWADDRVRRRETHVPDGVTFQESWRIGLDLIDRSRPGLPFGWVAGDDEFGRVSGFRAGLRFRRLRYVLDVPCNTSIRDLGAAAGARRPPWRRVDEWAQAQPSGRWRRLVVGAGAKGPRVVRVLEAWVQTRDEDRGAGPRERLVVIRTVDREPRVWYTLSNAPAEVPVGRVAEAHGRRHGIEEVLQAGKGEVGLGHYEVRSWVGWHHHMTLSLLALWFLSLEKRRLGGKNSGADRAPDAGGVRPAPATDPAERASDRRRSPAGASANRGGPHLPLVRRNRPVPATAGTA